MKVLFENCKINNEIDAYLLGFIYADGSIVGKNKDKHYILSISLSIKDEFHILKLNDILNGKISYHTSKIKGYDKVYKSIRLNKCDVSLVETLKTLGVNANKTYNCGTPQLFVPKSLIHHFIRGIFDGDGTIYKTKENKYVSGFVSCDKNLNNFIKLNLEENLKRSIVSKIEKEKFYRILLSGNKICLGLYNYLYKDSTIFLQRKLDKFKEIYITNGKHGMEGISYSPSRKTKKKWSVLYKTKNNKIYGGLFLTKEEACNKIIEIKKIYENFN